MSGGMGLLGQQLKQIEPSIISTTRKELDVSTCAAVQLLPRIGDGRDEPGGQDDGTGHQPSDGRQRACGRISADARVQHLPGHGEAVG